MSGNKRNTPPSGVQRAITQGAPMYSETPHETDTADSFGDEEDTNVGRPPHRRRATQADINKLGAQVGAWVEVDKKEHEEIRSTASSAISEIKTRLASLSDKIDENKTVDVAKVTHFTSGQKIQLTCGQSEITMTPMEIEIKSPRITITGSMTTEVEGGITLTLKGGLVLINS